MRVHRAFIGSIFLTLVFFSCRQEQNLTGSWRPVEVKIWNNYHNDSLVISLNSKQFYFDQTNRETLALMTPGYKDSLLNLLSKSYLTLKENGSFVMEDHAFFSQSLSDTEWHNFIFGNWRMNTNSSTLTLKQQNNLTKCYKIMGITDSTLDIGELYECNGRPITELSLKRQ